MDEEIEDERICRICFDPETENDPLLFPCLCDGHSKYIHTLCLDKWRQMNLNGAAFSKCMECNYSYNILYTRPKETYLIPTEEIYHMLEFNIYVVLTMLLFISSLFYRTIDVSLGTPTIMILDPKASTEFITLIQGDSIYSHMFYFSFLNFIIIYMRYIYLTISICRKIHQLGYYWYITLPIYVAYLFISACFYWFYYFCKITEMGFGTYLNMITFFYGGGLWVFAQFQLKHNGIIAKINRKNAGIVRNRILNV